MEEIRGGEILYTSPISDPLNEATLPATHPHTAPQMSVDLCVSRLNKMHNNTLNPCFFKTQI